MNMEPITTKEALSVLGSEPVAHLGVVYDGEPYVTPMSFVVDGDRILFRTLPGKKLEALRANPVVCVEVSRFDEGSGDWVSVILRGTAQETNDEAAGVAAVTMLLDKYREAVGSPLSRGGIQPLIGLPHVIEVTITEISGMTSGRGWSHRTKPGRL